MKIFFFLTIFGLMNKQVQDTCEQQMNHLNIYEGKWQYEIQVWPTPDAEPLTFKSSATNEFIYGGKFLKMSGISKVGDLTGESIGYLGFDPLKCKFTYYIISSVAQDATYAEGTYDEVEGVFVFEGKNIDPSTNKSRSFRIEMKFSNEETLHQRNYFEAPDGTYFLGVEVHGRKL